MQASNVTKSRIPREPRNILIPALAIWLAGALVVLAFPASSTGRMLTEGILYWTAAVFAVVLVTGATMRVSGWERLFWGLLGAGLTFTFVGDLGWTGFQSPGGGGWAVSFQQPSYLVSHLLLTAALLTLVVVTAPDIAVVTVLDALAVMLSTGTLAWFLFVDGTGGGWTLAIISSWALFDAALLFMGLVVLSASQGAAPAKLLALGFMAFLVADGLYLNVRSSGTYQVSGYPDLVWGLGVVFIGSSALWPDLASIASKERIGPWRVFAFWFGPLSPPLHFAGLFLWCAFRPPLPTYAVGSAIVLLLYLAARVAIVSFVTRRLSVERENAARQLESSRILYEMHETVKQSIHGIALSADAALEAQRRGEHGKAREMLGRTLAASREAEYRVSGPYEELQAIHGPNAPRAADHLRHRLRKFHEYFGIETHEDLQDPLDTLNAAEVAVVYRIVIEAFWNVAKHSRARNMYLASRRVGPTLILRIRDDGRGFDAENPPPGMGLIYVRQRAAEVGAKVDVISSSGRGACIQLRFDKG